MIHQYLLGDKYNEELIKGRKEIISPSGLAYYESDVIAPTFHSKDYYNRNKFQDNYESIHNAEKIAYVLSGIRVQYDGARNLSPNKNTGAILKWLDRVYSYNEDIYFPGEKEKKEKMEERTIKKKEIKQIKSNLVPVL